MNDKTTAAAGISRRSVLLGAAAGAGALALGAGDLAPTAEATTFVKGADISWMPQMEANGYYWNYSQMLDAMRDYVCRSLNVIKSAGVTPGWDQDTRRPTAAMDGFLNV